MSPPSSSFRRPANPVTQAAFRRQLRLEIYLPLGLTLLGIAVFVGVAAALSYGTPGAWADTTLILLAVPTALLLAILLSALAAAPPCGRSSSRERFWRRQPRPDDRCVRSSAPSEVGAHEQRR